MDMIKEDNTPVTINTQYVPVNVDTPEWELITDAILDTDFVWDVQVDSTDSDHSHRLIEWLVTSSDMNTNLVILHDKEEDTIYGWFINSLDDLLERIGRKLDKTG
jgi:hypothetical protein